MTCPYQQICGGCPYRNLNLKDYQKLKTEQFEKVVQQLNQENVKTGEPVFIADGTRRRAELAFKHNRGNLVLGFNESKSHEIINMDNCPLLTLKINSLIPQLRIFLREFCNIKVSEKLKNKKFRTYNVGSGDIWLTEAVNGVDVLLEINEPLGLEHRMALCDFANGLEDVARVSVQVGSGKPETIIEKNRPYLNIGGYQVFIPAGTFLQASDAGEQALINLVLKYIGGSQGSIADLFCGVGTFSYPLAANLKNKITAVDSSDELLEGFQKSVNHNTIPNIKICRKNLFKYPLDGSELKGFDIVVFDPPRAGAAAQTAQLASMPDEDKPQKVIAVSCNPHTFVNDANTLISGGYRVIEITLVDQFVYSTHSELVALFEKL